MASKKPGITLEDEAKSDSRIFQLDYELQEEIQSGSYGTVYVTRHRGNEEKYAVKVIDRSKLKKNDDNNTLREINIMKELKGLPNVVQLVDIYITPQTIHMVQTLAEGGDVFDRLANRVCYTEGDARKLSIILLKTLDYMHRHKIVHRDLKPENLLLKGTLDDSEVLLADFGFAKHVPEEGLKTRCGTPAFVAPEIVVGLNYKFKVDTWSSGCLLYMLIGGYPPFQDDTHRGLFRKIRAADFKFHDKYWSTVSIQAKQLISNLLTVDPELRLDTEEALKSPWLKIDENNLSRRDLSGSIAEMKRFNTKRKVQSAVMGAIWAVASTFRRDKISDLMQDLDRKDEESSSELFAPVDKFSHKFRMSINHKQKFAEIYQIGESINKGTFAVVHECLHREWNEKYAVKIVKRDGKSSTDEAVLHEVAIMGSLDHPNIVKVIDLFEEDDNYYVVLELLSGGDVFDRIVGLKSYTEKDARDLAKLLLQSIEFLHNNGIAHRDIKPQNILLASKDDHSTIKISDFGFAKRVHTPKSLTSRCGTPSFVAPEILKGLPYDQSCDMWSVGVTFYAILCGYTPFAGENQEAMFEKIKNGDFSFKSEDWSSISQDAKDLISSLLQVDTSKRLTASAALKSKWFTQEEKMLSSRDLSQTIDEIKSRKPLIQDLAKTFMSLGLGKTFGWNLDSRIPEEEASDLGTKVTEDEGSDPSLNESTK